MDSQAYYELQMLRQLEDAPHLTQRLAAEKMGVSVKLVHSVIKGLVRRGLVHARPRDGRSLSYLVTPKGLAEQVRLTYEFMEFSAQFFREARRRSSEVCRRLATQGVTRVAFLGTGELAEISYLGVKEHGLKLVAVFDESGGSSFLDLAVHPYGDIPPPGAPSQKKNRFDKILVTATDPAFPSRRRHLPEGLSSDERFVWIFDHDDIVQDIQRRQGDHS